jgi:hypothetical protein
VKNAMPSRRTIVVNVFVVDPDEVEREPDGTPNITANTSYYQLCLATPATGGGWLLETWRESDGKNQQRVSAASDVDTLIDDIAHAVRAIAQHGS